MRFDIYTYIHVVVHMLAQSIARSNQNSVVAVARALGSDMIGISLGGTLLGYQGYLRLCLVTFWFFENWAS